MNPTVKLTNSQEIVFSGSYIIPVTESEISIAFKELDFLVKYIFEENVDEKSNDTKIDFLDCQDNEAFFKVSYNKKKTNIGLLRKTFNLFHIVDGEKEDGKLTKTQYKVNFNIENKAGAAFLLHFQLIRTPSVVLERDGE
ncbi:hypothetical protein OGW02_10430 [Citrobacter sp. Ce105]|uniref:hypothetical protein n=1 Tax=Citrobacter sp. Ce105 TaxID=2985041 RepID=UPI00257704B3|nr:hypothetical protein [Citrobacter sp. Ce105]MDM3290058.1 hypothetical protein [Citrobacter sp. Ce105]